MEIFFEILIVIIYTYLSGVQLIEHAYVCIFKLF
jgi:hypothetical protein